MGVIIGKIGFSEKDNGGDSPHVSNEGTEGYRAARRSSGSVENDARSIGRVGSSPPAGYDDRVKHMLQLGKKIQFGRGMPDFDALFGVWETAREMNPEELRRALDELDEGGTLQRDGMFVQAMLMMQLAKKDGPTAMTYADGIKGQHFFPAKEMALQAWAKADPKGAYAWYEANKEKMNPRESMKFQASAIAGLAREDFDAAFAKAKQVDGLSQKNVLEGLGAIAVLDVEQRERFTKYVISLGKKEIVEEVGEKMARQLVQKDVQEAVAFVEDWPGEDKSELFEEVADEWARVEPEKALDWRLGKPGAERDVDDMFGDWAQRDSAAARNWLADQENQDARVDKDELRESAASRVMRNDDYPQAAKWAGSIANDEKRHDSYQSVYRRWARLDQEGAKRWAEGLDASAREAVIPNGDR